MIRALRAILGVRQKHPVAPEGSGWTWEERTKMTRGSFLLTPSRFPADSEPEDPATAASRQHNCLRDRAGGRGPRSTTGAGGLSPVLPLCSAHCRQGGLHRQELGQVTPSWAWGPSAAPHAQPHHGHWASSGPRHLHSSHERPGPLQTRLSSRPGALCSTILMLPGL